MNGIKQADVMVKNCSILTPEFEMKSGMAIVIADKTIIDIGPSSTMEKQYTAENILDGKGKLMMPGFVDSHMHSCQQLLRGRVTDELPMIWTRIMVPFESNLNEKDVYISSQLSCLEMIKAGTTSFVDAGGTFMHKVAESAIESGLRATITNSTMNTGQGIPESMKSAEDDLIHQNVSLYNDYHGYDEERIRIGFSLRSIITCTPSLIVKVFEKAKELGTGVQAHMNEYPNEIGYCLENYGKRPVEFLESLGVLGENFLSAHSILLSENEIDIMKQYNVKVAHCPISNSGKGIPKTPALLQRGINVGLGTDGAAHSGLSLFDQMKVFKSLMRASWGTPINDPLIMPSKKILEMATAGGANAVLQENIGTVEVGKKADLISILIDQPHILPTYNIANTLIESANSRDVMDVIVNGKIIMKNREVLTLDEEKINYESRLAAKNMAEKAGL